MAQFVDLVVDRRILLDIGVRLRNVRLGLVVVVVADKIADVIVGKEGLELARQLRCERLVVCNDEGWPLHLLDDLCHRVGLARARRTEQHLRCHSILDAARNIGDCLRLIPHRLERCGDLERNLPLEYCRIELWNHRHMLPSLLFSKSHFCIIAHSSCDGNSGE